MMVKATIVASSSSTFVVHHEVVSIFVRTFVELCLTYVSSKPSLHVSLIVLIGVKLVFVECGLSVLLLTRLGVAVTTSYVPVSIFGLDWITTASVSGVAADFFYTFALHQQIMNLLLVLLPQPQPLLEQFLLTFVLSYQSLFVSLTLEVEVVSRYDPASYLHRNGSGSSPLTNYV